MYIEDYIDACSPKTFYPGKEMSNELVWVFVALITQQVKRTRGILLSSVAYLNVP